MCIRDRNRPNEKDDSVVVVNKGRETDQFNKKQDDQVADNEVSNEMSESDYKMIMDMLRMIDKKFDERAEMMDKHFDELHTKLEETKEVMDKGFDMMNKHFDEMDKLMGEWRTDIGCLLYTSTLNFVF